MTEIPYKLACSLSALAVTVVCALCLLPATAGAADEPFEIQFDKSQIQIGPVGDLPLGVLEPGASLAGTIDDAGHVTIPKGSFTMPMLGTDEPVEVRGFMSINGPATGTFDAGTGRLELDGKAGIWLKVDAAALADLAGVDIGELIGAGGMSSLIKPFLSNLTCGFSPMDVHFTTESTSISSGSRFVDGPAGTGAITAEWSRLGPFGSQEKVLGLFDPCQMILDYMPQIIEGGLGGVLPEGFDLGGLDIESLLANLDDLDLGASSLTLTRTVDGHADVDPPDNHPGGGGLPTGKPELRLSVSPKKRKVRRGKGTNFKVRVANRGNATATRVKVCLKRPGNRVLRTRRCRNLGAVKAGAATTRVFKVRLKRRVKPRAARVGFVVTARNARRLAGGTRLLIRR